MTPGARQADLFDTPRPPLPDGFVYQPEFLTPEEEASLLAIIREISLEEARYKQFTAKRRTRSFGAGYDFDRNALTPAPPIPEFLEPLRARVGAWLQIPPANFTQALISEYRPGTEIGWHRDVPNFEVIVGVSLAGSCRLRLRPYPHLKGDRKSILSLEVDPRSVYAMRGEARWKWQHSIPPTKELRYSVTFRTPRGKGPGGPADRGRAARMT